MGTKIGTWGLAAIAALGLAPIGCSDFADNGENGTPSGGSSVSEPLRYVLIVDNDASPAGPTPGADLDAVELSQGGSSFYTESVEYFSFGSGGTPTHDPEQALGAPEGNCDDLDSTCVSLGGVGGQIILGFAFSAGGSGEIEVGNTITAHTCTGPASEFWDLFVGTTTSPDTGYWHPVIDDGRGTTTGTVGDLAD